jgi:hypothetical protein
LNIAFQGHLLIPCSEEEKRAIKLWYFSDLRKFKRFTLFDSSFARAFEQDRDERVLLLRAVTRYDRGETKDLSELSKLVDRLSKKSEKVYASAVTALGKRSAPSQYVLNCLLDILRRMPDNVRAWRQWTYHNLSMIQMPDNVAEYYASNAASGFWKLLEFARYSMDYLCQLSFLFFKYGKGLTNFGECAERFKGLDTKSVLNIVPQLVVQLEHADEDIRGIVFHILETLSERHFQAVALPLNLQRQLKAIEFIDKIFSKHRETAEEVIEFARSMTALAITPPEEAMLLLMQLGRLGEDFVPETFLIIEKLPNLLHTKKRGLSLRWRFGKFNLLIGHHIDHDVNTEMSGLGKVDIDGIKDWIALNVLTDVAGLITLPYVDWCLESIGVRSSQERSIS